MPQEPQVAILHENLIASVGVKSLLDIEKALEDRHTASEGDFVGLVVFTAVLGWVVAENLESYLAHFIPLLKVCKLVSYQYGPCAIDNQRQGHDGYR
jgi:hypothetical protein